MRDFTLKTYRALLSAFADAGYRIMPIADFLACGDGAVTVGLRHDVDEKAYNALAMANVEHELGIKSTYYFRIVGQSNVPEVIMAITAMGHEVGYHYEDLAIAEGDMDRAIATFRSNLAYFRQYYPVKTVCMHGSSTSKHDNRRLWDYYKLSDFGLVGEPYLSVDFSRVYYLTDIGRAWDGGRFAVRDVVANDFGLTFHSTQQIIDSLQRGQFPPKAMVLAHTLWTDNIVAWNWLQLREYARNNIKLIARDNPLVSRIYGTMVKHYWKHT